MNNLSIGVGLVALMMTGCGSEVSTSADLACEQVMFCSIASYGSQAECVQDAQSEPWSDAFIQCVNQAESCDAMRQCDD